VNRGGPSPSLELIEKHSRIVKPSLVAEFDVAIRKGAPDQSRNRIHHFAKWKFTSLSIVRVFGEK
jgi:hypothetical protein